jgi:hypothetical protein
MSSRQRKRERHEVLAAEKVPPSFLDWSEDAITFSREDHPNRIPNLGQYPLVVDPVIGNARFSKVLMDGGSSFNILDAHPVTVVSSFPLGEIIRNPDVAGRIVKWSVELMGETLAYTPCKEIKSQILTDFVAEWTDTLLPPPQIQAECWTLYFDGSVMKTGVGACLLFVSPLGEHMRYAVRLHFPASNNMAEYEALLCGLKIAI